MIQELIFNLYYYSTLELISEVGVVTHLASGTDEEKLKFLKDNVQADFASVLKFPLPDNIKTKVRGAIYNGIDHESYRGYCLKGHGNLIFENIFQHFNAPASPLTVITPVRDGKIFFEGTVDTLPPIAPFPSHIHIDKQDDWVIGYIDQEGLHLDRLIDDDFFAAIKVLFNSNHYVSAMKLLMICVDTMSFLEYGDVPGNFTKWLTTFAKLQRIGVESEELWEFRNSILHMSNLDSRKVKSNKVTRLLFYVAPLESNEIVASDEGKYFNFKALIDIVGEAIAKWADTFNTDREKFEPFIERYDRILSDKRATAIYHSGKFDT